MPGSAEPPRHDQDGPAPMSNVARRGALPVADADYLDYLSNLDARETILSSIISSGDQPLRAARSSWSSAVGRWGCRRA